tara:strand:- start:18712 stop:19308 length:597 start_codon:yes stop_codon:yes gene_type:complete
MVFSQALHFVPQLFFEPMRDEVNGGAVDAEIGGDLSHWLTLAGVKLESLKVFGRDPASQPLHGGIEHMFLPFKFPKIIHGIVVGQAIQRIALFPVFIGKRRAGTDGGLIALAEFVGDTPAGLVHQPPAEGTAIFPRLIIPDPLCDILQNVLDHIIGLGVPQTRPQGQALDETSVEAVELIPTRVIAPVAETEEEARSG